MHKAVYQKDFESIEELYPVGSQCFMMASPHYGCAGEVCYDLVALTNSKPIWGI